MSITLMPKFDQLKEDIEKNIQGVQQTILEIVFPVGSTYITQEETDPSTILGFGTWERLKGKVCLGLDEDDEDFSTIGNTGGEKEHTLTVDETPKFSRLVQTNQRQSGQLPLFFCKKMRYVVNISL